MICTFTVFTSSKLSNNNLYFVIITNVPFIKQVVDLNYGMGRQNPIDYVRFYSKENPQEAVMVRKSQVRNYEPKSVTEPKLPECEPNLHIHESSTQPNRNHILLSTAVIFVRCPVYNHDYECWYSLYKKGTRLFSQPRFGYMDLYGSKTRWLNCNNNNNEGIFIALYNKLKTTKQNNVWGLK